MSGAVTLFGITSVIVAAGCLLFIAGFVGWAQFCWVLSSGTAGAAVMSWLDRRR